MKKDTIAGGCLLLIVICVGLTACKLSVGEKKKEFTTIMYKDFIVMKQPDFFLANAQEIVMKGLLFPKNIEALNESVDWIKQEAQGLIDKLIAEPHNKRSYESTVLLYDQAVTAYKIIEAMTEAYALVCPDDLLRTACLAAHEVLQKKSFDIFYRPEVYEAFKQYAERVQEEKIILTPEQEYLLRECLRDCLREGLDKPRKLFEQIQQVKKELCSHAVMFEALIAQDNRFIIVEKKDLVGLSPEFIAQLEAVDEKQVKLTTSYPIYFEVMGHCKNVLVRRRLYRLFHNRAYPENYDILAQMIYVRDHLARLLGYSSFVALDLENCMAKDEKTVRDFLKLLEQRARVKYEKEIAALTQELPDGEVSVTSSGKISPWDLTYLMQQYKKKNYDLDDRLVAEYFPVEKVLEGVFDLYAHFLDLNFSLITPEWSWHDELLVIQVNDKKTNLLRGYIYLDLYPRKNKYSHACHAGIVPTIFTADKKATPSIALVVANFPRATADKPALLKFSDVETFLHEFGHAMHFLLGTTGAGMTSGTSVKIDFVEMPSQMFEEWLYEPAVLARLSAHYRTKEPLPEELIEKIIAVKQFDSGFFIMRQIALAELSLALFGESGSKNISSLQENIFTRLIPHIAYDEHNHFVTSFGHLGGYSARYYCYLWSKVYALDLFDFIKKNGVTDPAIGRLFIDKVIGRGGSRDPQELLKDFLGRAPSMEPFFKDMGV